jgi:hypothetical protein
MTTFQVTATSTLVSRGLGRSLIWPQRNARSLYDRAPSILVAPELSLISNRGAFGLGILAV